jgi:hypothetical protein
LAVKGSSTLKKANFFIKVWISLYIKYPAMNGNKEILQLTCRRKSEEKNSRKPRCRVQVYIQVNDSARAKLYTTKDGMMEVEKTIRK